VKPNNGMWKRLPFARLLSCSLLGILLNNCLETKPFLLAGALLIVLLLVLLFHFLPLWLRWKWKTWRGMLLFFALLLCAALHHSLHSVAVPENVASDHGLLIRITASKATAKTMRYTATFFSTEPATPVKKAFGYVYLPKEGHQKLREGDLLFTALSPKKISNNSNPGSFDFAAYAARKGIFYSLYLGDPGDWILLRSSPVQPSFLEKTRDGIIRILKKNLHDRIHLGLAEALLIGYRDDLDNTILNAYTDTGVVHIIAISGLHLGLIFVLINKLIVLVLGKSRSPLASLAISIPLLWGFALLTGGSASVLRSALMFSMMIVGKALERKHASMNALLASAFILLLYDPDMIHDLGFQLSYAAVGSILLFERGIKNALYLNNKLAKLGWGMISITLAAQVLTTPLVVAHFHRFPLLFLLANLVAVPIASALLLTEIILVAVHPIHLLANGLSQIIIILIECMNGYVLMISAIPHAVMEGISLSTPMILLVYLFIFLLKAGMEQPSKASWYGLLFVLFLGALIRMVEQIQLINKKSVVVLQLSKESCVVVQSGSHGRLYLRNTLLRDTLQLNSVMKATANGLGISKWKIVVMPPVPLLLSSGKMTGFKPTGQQPFLLITGSRYTKHDIRLKALDSMVPQAYTLVADGSNTVWKIRQWEKEAHELHLRLHPTPEKGAYTFP
jgi:competence protein ComEC